MIEIVNIANGLVRAVWIVKKNTRIRATIVLTDPDGDIDNIVIQHKADADVPARLFFLAVAQKVDDAPHLRVVLLGDELSIGTASQDYSAEVTVEIV